MLIGAAVTAKLVTGHAWVLSDIKTLLETGESFRT